MPIFYLTVGQRYRHEEHPCGLHPDGWAAVHADNIEEARLVAHSNMGPKFCAIYDREPELRLYPRGCTHHFWQGKSHEWDAN